MTNQRFIDIDPAVLHVPPSRMTGADPTKYHHQLRKFGSTFVAVPTIEVQMTTDGRYIIYDGVTRATRMAKLAPGKLIRAEVTAMHPGASTFLPTIGDLI